MNLAPVLSFLRELAVNNNKTWMDAHRGEYQRARTEFTELMQMALQGLQQFEPELAGNTAAASQYRINKNDRFQQSNEPYKKHMGAGFARDGRHSPWAGYFLAVGPNGTSWVGAGKWRPETPAVARIRQEIHYNAPTFHALRQHSDMLHYYPDGLEGDRLQRPPKGYDKNDPDLEWLKLKDFFVSRSFTDAQVLKPNFAQEIVTSFRAAQPLVNFLNQALMEG
ncbi:conserved hypothetical protein [Hymenobacter roseosalivarius DSM 11622]|uniref:TIGR02453 family protein n=1 Tax=Hymenobacter roseosalivarius DSM 11622 TaxID=645990 RepID=A0A1W1VD11_9BACT|nr:DUF2461 domain-containing protein [Hymenobacter roseosalivarius]SMB90834.1 conserved hypothetical protein [Hymenobacter roseosalivarius DSM 11622]